MSVPENALPPEGAAKPAQKPEKLYTIDHQDRLLLPLTLLFCLLTVHTVLWCGPAAGMTAAVFAWYCLLLTTTGVSALATAFDRALLPYCLFLSVTLAIGSNWMFRVWNFLALGTLLPIHALGLGGSARLPWWRPGMAGERFSLLLWGLFAHLGTPFAALDSSKKQRNTKRILTIVLSILASLVLLAILIPVLASADALFAAATADARRFFAQHFTVGLRKLALALAMTPFVFGLLYSLRHPKPLAPAPEKRRSVDDLAFVLILAALAGLYALFLAVQSAGLFGGAEYLARRGLSYAEWARSGFFQMVGVTLVNLTVLLASLSLARRTGRTWTLLRLLAALLTLESGLLLLSAAWRMTLYVSVYGLSFKRAMTYWGMAMMALFFLAAARKIVKPDFRFFRAALPLALAGWLVINCVPVDYLVAKDQVDRYLDGESAAIDVEYLLYDLSYDTLSQLDRLDGDMICRLWDGEYLRLNTLIAQRRSDARNACTDWRTWSLSACLASDG